MIDTLLIVLVSILSGHSAVNIGKSKVVVFGGLVDKRFLSDVVVYDIEDYEGELSVFVRGFHDIYPEFVRKFKIMSRLVVVLSDLSFVLRGTNIAFKVLFFKLCIFIVSDNKLWFQPECTGNGSNGQVGPGPRAFHIAVAIDCHMFIFGGRFGSRRLGDFWVLDTDIWQWSELTSFGDLPSPRDFAAASAIGNRKIVMYGGWDGKKWLSDVYVLDTISLEWMQLPVTGSVPPPRCGHTATMVEKRLLIYGGRGGGGPIMGDLWALKGLIEEENETPGWTQLKLPGQAPSSRCGHTITSGGHYVMTHLKPILFVSVLMQCKISSSLTFIVAAYFTFHYFIHILTFGFIVLAHLVSAQWKRLPIGNEPPPARAYHSMTCLGSLYLLFGGFDGKSTFGDIWWLVPEEDPIAKRYTESPPKVLPENKDVAMENYNSQFAVKESQRESSTIVELQKKLDISVSLSRPGLQIMDELEDEEFLELASRLMGAGVFSNGQVSRIQATQVLRDHWKKSTPRSIPIKELGPLLRDYQRLIARHLANLQSTELGLPGKEAYTFYHLKNSSQV
ncbi:hypothetical protein WN943_018873 [Citrus x changshan-huyou]